jgi:hypothetical protein
MPTQTADPTQFVEELRKFDLSRMTSKWMLERNPFIFGDDQDLCVNWKHDLGARIGVDPRAIQLVGSACVGFSLSPNKAYRKFDSSSDVDVAAISDLHFDIAWTWMRNLGAERHRLPPVAKAALEDHRERLVYWGAIASDRILAYLPFGKIWVPGLSAMSARDPIGGRNINVRIFRDFTALRAYHLANFEKLRDNAYADNPER